MSANVHPGFKVPECIPQDLLLIQEPVGEVSISQPTNSQKAAILEVEDDDINSSGSDNDSEDELDEVEAHLLVTGEEGNGVLPPVKA